MVKPGRYRHYKGKEYEVIGCARHSETEEEYVVYRALYGDHGLWVRPKALFVQHVTVEGRAIPRFAPIIEEGVRPWAEGRSRPTQGRAGDTTPGAGGCDEEGSAR